MAQITLKKRLLAYSRALFEKRARAHIARHTKLRDALAEYVARSGSTGCNYLDYWELYKAVRTHRPREILECGTGVSTIVLAFALEENERESGVRGRITSLEEEPRYYEIARQLLPAACAPYVEILQSPRVEDHFGMFRGVRYRDVPARPYDFVFVDGPNYVAPSDGAVTFDFDLIHVLRTADHPVFAIVDKRVTTCFVMQRLLGPHLVRYDARKHLCFIGPATRDSFIRLETRAVSDAFTASFRLLGKSVLNF